MDCIQSFDHELLAHDFTYFTTVNRRDSGLSEDAKFSWDVGGISCVCTSLEIISRGILQTNLEGPGDGRLEF